MLAPPDASAALKDEPLRRGCSRGLLAMSALELNRIRVVRWWPYPAHCGVAPPSRNEWSLIRNSAICSTRRDPSPVELTASGRTLCYGLPTEPLATYTAPFAAAGRQSGPQRVRPARLRVGAPHLVPDPSGALPGADCAGLSALETVARTVSAKAQSTLS
jgi:hypothetical protein